ncbi:hypothetical protein HK100_003207 [Physocladia obscura]|uniref:Uncharacterized protein n=1 Tax=Physocladia obscura TaxID=109957 RepID=A0AAD5SWX8_9FUNG|nr:hypothetical protein HK100_003207 [Physocladia obscura]
MIAAFVVWYRKRMYDTDGKRNSAPSSLVGSYYSRNEYSSRDHNGGGSMYGANATALVPATNDLEASRESFLIASVQSRNPGYYPQTITRADQYEYQNNFYQQQQQQQQQQYAQQMYLLQAAQQHAKDQSQLLTSSYLKQIPVSAKKIGEHGSTVHKLGKQSGFHRDSDAIDSADVATLSEIPIDAVGMQQYESEERILKKKMDKIHLSIYSFETLDGEGDV